ncbi:hypothetical protein PHYSODRAFT_298767 [Phytophthora sojae]|uniref:GATA-type domain-containing protein n=1 Tax=Phytophthora sojae (strain P6497) TaxID=1094619 RepID=G4Z3S6_PHYSP|nr:hypothetical protein PHYSODRAFT_298767 [Phytophthora sojae]EGZ20785.1 hypothetical protein PHYSODRAFT_298767 [Phytophthora sojae]|eukprot:XP_009523502.1 hypothetical protein PHYSODRAFT_298767 [Phytophthora sojae]
MSSSTSVPAKHASRPFRVGSDGLPLLPCHDARVTVAFAEAARAPPPPRAVSAFGSVDSPAAVRRQLEALYARTQQLPALSEATLRADTELELLRRRCFAQRNAQWGYTTPDQLEFRPQPHAQWTPQPANAKLALRQAKIDGALDKELAFSAADGARGRDQPLQPVRDRPWPPVEFALKTVAKPARGRGGKRKAAPMAAVLDPVPLLARTCRECGTQSTPLWRSQTQEQTPADAQQQAQAVAPTPTPVSAQQKLDLCLRCYLKLERADLFDKKRVEKRREERRKKEQAAAAALQEKKRLKHQIHALKKQQKEHKKQEAVDDEQLMEQVPREQQQEEEAPVILKFTREEIEAATGSSKERKKDRKHSRKDKKKKKKKHRRKHELEVESDSDGPTPIPSPAQMNGFVYADRAPEPYTTPQTSAFTVDHAESAKRTEAMVVETEPEALDDSDDRGFNEEDDMSSTPARSSRKRKSVQRAEPVAIEESPSSASKKRKTSSSRSSRSKRSAASAPLAPAVVAVPPAPIVKKRARTKKELARERELRALGQYCPVCSEVYEDDDQSTFVCCDSCELWVHGACDPSLTPYVAVKIDRATTLISNTCVCFMPAGS